MMKIVRLQAENVKKIKAIDITPTDNTVIISGKNGAGKTSVLDSIFYALCGNDSEHTKKPIRNGQEKAYVKVDLGDYIVTRNWTSNENTYLKVESKEGARYPNPQTLLNKIIGELSFDPLEFCNMPEKDQVRTLLGITGLETVLNEIDGEKKRLYEQRTFVNRDLTQIKAMVEVSEKQKPDLKLPTVEVSYEAVVSKLKQAQSVLGNNNNKRSLMTKNIEALKVLESDKEEIEAEIECLQKRLHSVDSEITKKASDCALLKQEVNTISDPNIDEINDELVNLQNNNNKIRIANQHRRLMAELVDKEATASKLSDTIKDLDSKKTSALRSAKFPIEGVSFSDDVGVVLNGIPLLQCSAAERLKVSIAIAMALNPKVRIIRIVDGSLLDADNLEAIKAMARDRDYQIWLEVVDSTGCVGIYIEDGTVKEGGQI